MAGGADSNTDVLDAIAEGDPAGVVEALQQGDSPEAENRVGYSALMLACMGGDALIVNTLLQWGARVDRKYQGKNGWHHDRTALSFSAERNNVAAIEALVAQGAKVDSLDNSGLSPLYWAAMECQTRAVDRLLAHGADPNLASPDGETPLGIAADQGCFGVVELLVGYGAKVNVRNKWGVTPLTSAESMDKEERIEDYKKIVDLLSKRGATN